MKSLRLISGALAAAAVMAVSGIAMADHYYHHHHYYGAPYHYGPYYGPYYGGPGLNFRLDIR